MTSRTPTWLAYACLAASVCLVGSYVGLSKVLVAALPVFILAWLRFAIAAVAMATWAQRQPDEPRLAGSARQLLFWESFIGNFLFSICMLYGVAMTSALAAGLALAAIPAVVALLSWLFLGERISARLLIAIVLAMCGLGLMALQRDGETEGGPSALLGHALLLGAVVCEASYVVIGKRLTANLSPKRISALINLWGLALMTPLGLWQALQFDFAAVRVGTWALLVFYALAASMVSVWLWMRGLKEVPAPRAGVFMVLLPLSASAVGVGLLGESFTRAHGLALVLALGSLLLATWPTADMAALPVKPQQ